VVALVRLRLDRHLLGFVTTLCVLLFTSVSEGWAQTADQAQLTAIGLENTLTGRVRLPRQRLVHEPEDTRGRHERQQRKQDEDPGAAVHPAGGRSELDGHWRLLCQRPAGISTVLIVAGA